MGKSCGKILREILVNDVLFTNHPRASMCNSYTPRYLGFYYILGELISSIILTFKPYFTVLQMFRVNFVKFSYFVFGNFQHSNYLTCHLLVLTKICWKHKLKSIY